MPNSPSHQLGEEIGDFFEYAIIQYLKPIVSQAGYYLDYRHPRAARNNKREVIGIDYRGNKHKLDIVIEKDGSEENFGIPKAFIEIAWRRYVKHSKNKVQEIAGAILPLIETHIKERPFYAAVLAGEFTTNAIVQLESQGFYVLYFNYEEICRLFETIGLSIHWEEKTSEEDITKIIRAFQLLNNQELEKLLDNFFLIYQDKLIQLSQTLREALTTTITEVIVVPIHGTVQISATVSDAVKFIMDYDETFTAPILRYEITLKYSDGDEYTVRCSDKRKAIQFLNQYHNI